MLDSVTNADTSPICLCCIFFEISERLLPSRLTAAYLWKVVKVLEFQNNDPICPEKWNFSPFFSCFSELKELEWYLFWSKALQKIETDW